MSFCFYPLTRCFLIKYPVLYYLYCTSGGAGVDGFFAVKRNRFGCPPTLAERELIICPFLPDTVGLNPEQEQEEVETDTLKGGIDASENLPYSSSTKATESNFHSDTAGTQTLRTKKFDILSPALLSPSDWPFSVSDLMQLALGPPKIRYPLDASSALLVPPQRSDLSGTIATSFSGNTKNSIGVSGMKKQSEGGIMSSREAYSLLFQSGVETVKAWARTVDITEYASLTQTVDTL